MNIQLCIVFLFLLEKILKNPTPRSNGRSSSGQLVRPSPRENEKNISADPAKKEKKAIRIPDANFEEEK